MAEAVNHHVFSSLSKPRSHEFFASAYQELIFLRSYARWDDKKGRRERWPEAVERYISHFRNLFSDDDKKVERGVKRSAEVSEAVWEELRTAILKMEILPSMRALQFAGPALERNDMCAYNCSFLGIKSISSFVDILFISLCGTGVGFSVEKKFINKLPMIKNKKKMNGIDANSFGSSGKSSLSSSRQDLSGGELSASNGSSPYGSVVLGESNDDLPEIPPIHFIDDSREGWADALKIGLTKWFDGEDVRFDYSNLRPKGSKLKTTGGRASGPEPLKALLDFTRDVMVANRGKNLTSLQCHDIACKIGECVVTGGVRRTAMISLSDLDDVEMRDAKKGQFWQTHPHRCMANNSAVYETVPSDLVLMKEWMAMVESQAGERGIFNRGCLKYQLPSRRRLAIGDEIDTMGTNPCGEVLLLCHGLCNLSTVVARCTDTETSLLKKVELATILGTLQSCLVKFHYVQPEWSENAIKERLLGVSITGQQDCEALRNAETLKVLKDKSRHTNKIWAKLLGINRSSAITLTKPEGTCSQLVNSSSGIHPRWSKFYIRRVRISATDPLCKFLMECKVPHSPESFQTPQNATTWVFDFPMRAPEGAITKDELSAIKMLEYWLMVKKNYCEHNPSTTINYRESEIINVLDWLKRHWMYVGGLAFLPGDDHIYSLAPYEKISEKKYLELATAFPKVDFGDFEKFEKEDCTVSEGEPACVGDKCDI